MLIKINKKFNMFIIVTYFCIMMPLCILQLF